MNKDLLYKYFMDEASEEEVDRIIRWVESSKKNLDFFAEQKALWDISADINRLGKEKSSRKTNKFRVAYYSAAAIIIILLATNLIFMLSGQSTPVYESSLIVQLPSEELRTLYTEKGVKAHIVLPDSSQVWLNSDSRITYPAVFGNRIREVELSGEAYFEVIKDSLHPMIVKTNKDFSIEVLGTSFSVRSYNNDNTAKATLFSGSISMHYRDVRNNEHKVLKLNPKESFIYYQANSAPEQVKYENNDKEIAWKRGELLFDRTPVEDVLKMLERWHGTEFVVENKAIFNDKLTASFQTESIVQIMEMMKYCIDMDYKINNNTVTITKVKK